MSWRQRISRGTDPFESRRSSGSPIAERTKENPTGEQEFSYLADDPDGTSSKLGKHSTWARVLRDPRAIITGIIILFGSLMAITAPIAAPYPPNQMAAKVKLQGPSSEHLLGTDEFGRDLLSRLIYGARLSLTISTTSIAIAAVIGTFLGLIAGYYGGITETIIMRGMDFLLALPSIFLALFVMVFAGASMRNLIITIGVLFTPGFARVVQGVVLAAKHFDYVEAAKAIGAPDWRILLHTILPNVTGPTLVQGSLAIGNAMILEASLSFLGLGPPPPATSWGRMIAEATSFMQLNPYELIWPALIISIMVLAFNILGDALRDASDPRLR